MQNDKTFEDRLQCFEEAISSAPSVADGVMQRVQGKPIPRRRRQWTRSPALVASAVAAVCLVGATIAAWIVADGRDAVNVALNAGDHYGAERGQQDRKLVGQRENQPGVIERPDETGGSVPTAKHYHRHDPHSAEDRIARDRAGTPGPSGQRIGWDLANSQRLGDMKIEDDRVDAQPKIVVSTRPETADGETRTGSAPDGRAGEQRPASEDSAPMGRPERHTGDRAYGETNGERGWERDSAGPVDGLNGGPVETPGKSRLSESEAIRLAAKCIRDAEPVSTVKLDTESAVTRYYGNAKAYNGNSLWLVGFPETGREGRENSRGENDQAVLYRMVWVQEDGSFSGNCQGELPPTQPPVLLGRDDEAKAIQLAKSLLLRHHPELVGNRPPTATFNRDCRAAGGGPLWMVGFERKENLQREKGIIRGQASVQSVWVTLDGAVMLGPLVGMGPTVVVPRDEANASDSRPPKSGARNPKEF
jgi:hypothetical protein